MPQQEKTTLDNQFWPTPKSLGERVFDKFKVTPRGPKAHILEPQAGRGDMFEIDMFRHCGYSNIDAVEIDFENAAILRSKGFNVVGHDFLQFEGLKSYTHIAMNPCFNRGAEHLLHAIDIMRKGEIVCILNAQTIKNPCDKHRRRLTQLLDKLNADIEFLDQAFLDPDTKRKTAVQIALIHIEIEEDNSLFSFLDDLKPEIEREGFNVGSNGERSELIVKEDTVHEAVSIFNAAVKALRNEVSIKYRLISDSKYYASMLAKSIIDESKDQGDAISPENKYNDANDEFNQRYTSLKDQAWSHILTATEAGKKLSSGSLRRLKSEFSKVSSQEFTVSNIFGFLHGLIAERGEMNVQMLCELFDSFTGWYSENRAHYIKWKSNDKHKENAYRLKTNRFILPMRNPYFSSFTWENQTKLKDFDLGFSMLAGDEIEDIYGLYDLVTNPDEEVKSAIFNSERMDTKYFQVRYYHRTGSMHFYPKDKKLVDRLNRVVGAKRGWIPQGGEEANDTFWEQYNSAEAIQRKLDKDPDYKRLTTWGNGYGENAEQIMQCIFDAGEACGLDMMNLLSSNMDAESAAEPLLLNHQEH